MENWALGLLLIVLTIVIHAAGVAAMALGLQSVRRRIEGRGISFAAAFTALVGLIGVIGLLLAVLHGIEAGFWALAYWWAGYFASPAAATLYSLEAITTRSAPGLTLEGHWPAMGALEAADGMLLFGISTGFIVAVMQQCWPILVSSEANEEPSPPFLPKMHSGRFDRAE